MNKLKPTIRMRQVLVLLVLFFAIYSDVGAVEVLPRKEQNFDASRIYYCKETHEQAKELVGTYFRLGTGSNDDPLSSGRSKEGYLGASPMRTEHFWSSFQGAAQINKATTSFMVWQNQKMQPFPFPGYFGPYIYSFGSYWIELGPRSEHWTPFVRQGEGNTYSPLLTKFVKLGYMDLERVTQQVTYSSWDYYNPWGQCNLAFNGKINNTAVKVEYSFSPDGPWKTTQSNQWQENQDDWVRIRDLKNVPTTIGFHNLYLRLTTNYGRVHLTSIRFGVFHKDYVKECVEKHACYTIYGITDMFGQCTTKDAHSSYDVLNAARSLVPKNYGETCPALSNVCGELGEEGIIGCNGKCTSVAPPTLAGRSCNYGNPNACGSTLGVHKCNAEGGGTFCDSSASLPNGYNDLCDYAPGIPGRIDCSGKCAMMSPTDFGLRVKHSGSIWKIFGFDL
jgi:hypothetical protein